MLVNGMVLKVLKKDVWLTTRELYDEVKPPMSYSTFHLKLIELASRKEIMRAFSGAKNFYALPNSKNFDFYKTRERVICAFQQTKVRTADALSVYLDLDIQTVQLHLEMLVDDGILVRGIGAKSNRYGLSDNPPSLVHKPEARQVKNELWESIDACFSAIGRRIRENGGTFGNVYELP